MATPRFRRLALGATFCSGLGLVGVAAYGVTSLDGRLAAASEVQQQRLEQVVRTNRAQPCPHRFRGPSEQRGRSISL